MGLKPLSSFEAHPPSHEEGAKMLKMLAAFGRHIREGRGLCCIARCQYPP